MISLNDYVARRQAELAAMERERQLEAERRRAAQFTRQNQVAQQWRIQTEMALGVDLGYDVRIIAKEDGYDNNFTYHIELHHPKWLVWYGPSVWWDGEQLAIQEPYCGGTWKVPHAGTYRSFDLLADAVLHAMHLHRLADQAA